jgi:hypothetical protein
MKDTHKIAHGQRDILTFMEVFVNQKRKNVKKTQQR